MPGYLLAFFGGLLLGGVINWLADQLPLLGDRDEEDEEDGISRPEKGQGLSSPRCVHCGAVRPPLAYLGLAAWMLAGRRCANCGRLLSFRHPLVEIISMVACAYVWWLEGLTPMLGILIFYLALFLLIAVIDVEHRLVLNVIMLPAFAIALAEVVLSGRIRLRDALIGYAIGQIVVMGFYLLGAVYLWIVNTARREPVTEVAFGFGDVTLATFCGMIVGYPGVVYMLVLMILLGGLFAFVYLLYRLLVVRDYRPHAPLAYGPAVVLGATIMLLWGGAVDAWVIGPH